MASGIIGSLLILLKTKSDINGITRADRALRKTNNTAKMLKNSLRLLSGIGLILGGKSVIGNYLEFEKSLGAVHSRFNAITNDTVKAEQQFESVRNMARGLGLDMFETANAYSIFFSGTSKTLGEQGAQQVFESWSKISRVLHLTPYQMERVTYALREMSSKGAVYSQDLRMQIGTHVPNAVTLATQAIQNLGINGVKSIEDFQKVSKGNIPMINKFIKEFSKLAEIQFASPKALEDAMKQPDALSNIIKNFGTDFLIEFSKAGGNELVLEILNTIIAVLKSIDFKQLANNLAILAKIVGGLATFLIKNIPLLINTIIALVTVLTANKIKNMGLGIMSANPFFTKYYQGTSLFSKSFVVGVRPFFKSFFNPLLKFAGTALKFFGGFWGLLATIIISALINFVPKLWNGITTFFDDRARTVDSIEDINKVKNDLQSWVNKYKNELSPEEMNKLLEKNKAYVMYQGQKVPAKVDQSYNIVVNVPNMPDNTDPNDFSNRVTDLIMGKTKEQIEKDAQKSLIGAYNPKLRGGF